MTTMAPNAYCLIRQQPCYRRDAFCSGLERAGFHLHLGPPPGRVDPDDVLVIWNRYGDAAHWATRFPAGRVFVCENGYLGHDVDGRQHYAIALDGHNGSGQWRVGGPERWEALGYELAPWRVEGRHVLVCGQRGFGYSTMAMRDGWQDDVLARIRARTARPVFFRPHPARRSRLPTVHYDAVLDFERPLSEQLQGAWAVVVWSSNAATEALVSGIPVFFEGPHIVTDGAAERGLDHLELPLMPDRLPAFWRMAWAQWALSEIEAGEPFTWLLERDGHRVCA